MRFTVLQKMSSPFLLFLLLVALVCTSLVATPANGNRKPNLVLIYGDDMRTDLNQAYGRKDAITPNLDRFAKLPGTVVFEKAYSNYPMCSPSRTSTLFGRLPIATGILTNLDDEDAVDTRNALNPSLPKYLQSQGYYTLTGGKVFHEPGVNGDGCWNETYDATVKQTVSWCRNDKRASKLRYTNSRKYVSPQICITTASLASIPDVRVATNAIRALKRVQRDGRYPFFLAIGFYKPHVPLQIHRRFWNSIPAWLPDAEHVSSPQPASSFAFRNLTFAEDANTVWAVKQNVVDLTVFTDKSSNAFRRIVRRAYAAGMTQTDYAFGLVLDALDALAMLPSTLIVFASDHGYSLGENNMWGKNALFDNLLRVPLIMSVPWLAPAPDPTPDRVNRVTTTFVELVDLYKTLTSLMNLTELPVEVEGVDHSFLVSQAIRTGTETLLGVEVGSSVAVVARCGRYDTCVQKQVDVTAIGFTYRNIHYRYTVWLKAFVNRTVNWNDRTSVLTQELYDHSNDNATLFNYAGGAVSYEAEYYNLAHERPQACDELFEAIKYEFTK